MLCPEAPCSRACPEGVDPARRVRSLYFDNLAGAALALPQQDPCARCGAPCQSACLRPEGPLRIRRVFQALQAARPSLEGMEKGAVDLSCDFCGDWGGYPNKNVQCGYHCALLACTIFAINDEVHLM